MKGYGGGVASTTTPQQAAKRRWRSKALTILILVFLSLMLPLAFLLGLHTKIPSGYAADDRSEQERTFPDYQNVDAGEEPNPSEGDEHRNAKISNDFALAFQKDADNVPHEELHDGDNNTIPSLQTKGDTFQNATIKDDMPESGVSVTGNSGVSEELPPANTKTVGEDGNQNHDKVSYAYETESSCELEFGSYCLWSRRHREVMKDSIVKRLKDQLFVARAYYPSIAKLKGYEDLTRELKLNIQDHERMLSEAVSDPDLPPLVENQVQKMDAIIAKAKLCTVECNNIDRKFRQLLDLTEDEAHFHMKQSAFLYQLGVQTLSKSFHCLSMRLTVEFFKSPPVDMDQSSLHKIGDPVYQHYVIFSRNILALSVTINSTVVNSEESDNMVFHVLTDKEKFYSIKHWFSRNSYSKATIDVLNFDELKVNLFSNSNLAELSMSEEFRVSSHSISQSSPLEMRTKYLSVFGHSQFLLSDIFKNLRKVILLDDDVVVQKDISFLWNLNLGGKVLGATEFCEVKLGQLNSYLGASGYDSYSCVWMSGISIIDLDKWREQDITGIYRKFLYTLQHVNEAQWRAAALPASLLAFHGQIHALDNNLIQQGLGHDYGVPVDSLRNVAALHYNGNMKPWLDLAIPKYKKYWKKYLTQDENFMEECNVNP